MRDIAIKEAVLAAKLFLIRAKAFSDATRNSDGSYDLTRALARMRKP